MTILDLLRKPRKLKRVEPTEHSIGFDEFGAEIHPEGRSPEMPVKLRRVESRDAAILRMIQSQLSRSAQQRGFETLEESDDFEIDDQDPMSPYEVHGMQEEEPLVDKDGQLNLPPPIPPPGGPAPAGAGASEDRKSVDVVPSEGSGTVPDGKPKA